METATTITQLTASNGRTSIGYRALTFRIAGWNADGTPALVGPCIYRTKIHEARSEALADSEDRLANSGLGLGYGG